jgi:hypothetical protein
MVSRRLVSITSILATAIICFTVGVVHMRRHDAESRASYEHDMQALRSEMRAELDRSRGGEPEAVPAATTGKTHATSFPGDATGSRARMVAEIKQELQSEMGLLPVQLLRERRSSFVELYS